MAKRARNKKGQFVKKEMLELPKPEKKVAARVLVGLGWSTRKVEQLLGVDHSSVARYAKETTPKEMRQFETQFELTIKAMKRKGVALVQKRLLELIPKEKRIDQVVKAGDYLEGKGPQQTQQTQVNIFQRLGKQDKGFVEGEIEDEK